VLQQKAGMYTGSMRQLVTHQNDH